MSDPHPEAAPKRSRWRRLLRLVWRIGLVVLGLLLILRLSHPLWLPGLVERLAAKRGLSLTYEDLDLELHLGRVSLTRVEVRQSPPKGDASDASAVEADATPLALLEHLNLDLDVSALFLADLRLHRAVVDGLELLLERDASGRWNLEPLMTAAAEPSADPGDDEPAESAPTESARADNADALEPRALDLGAPLQIDAALVHGLRVHLRDALAVPALDTELELNIAVRDIGHPERPLRFDIDGWSQELLGHLSLQATLRSGERTLRADGQVSMEELKLARLGPYLELVGLRPCAEELRFETRFHANLQPLTDNEVDLGGTLELQEFDLATERGPAVKLGTVAATIGRASTRAAIVDELIVRGLRMNAARSSGGGLQLAGIELGPSNAQPGS